MVPYTIYFLSLFSIHVIYALVYIGVISTVPKYVYYWNTIVQIGLCLFLMYRYHPFRTHQFKPLDGKMIFGAATLLLFNIVSFPFVYSYLIQYIEIDQ